MGYILVWLFLWEDFLNELPLNSKFKMRPYLEKEYIVLIEVCLSICITCGMVFEERCLFLK